MGRTCCSCLGGERGWNARGRACLWVFIIDTMSLCVCVFLKIPIRKAILAWIWARWLFWCPWFSCSTVRASWSIQHIASLALETKQPQNKSKNPGFLAGCSVAVQGNSQQSAKSGSPLITHSIPLLVEHPCGCSLGFLCFTPMKTRNEHFGVTPGAFRPLSIPVAQPPGSQDE